jgi:hypothetical protein
MGIKKAMTTLSNSYETIRLASVMTPQVSKIVKKMGESRVFEALTDDAKMEVFAKDVYSQLTIDIKSKISLEAFIPMILNNKKKLLKNKANQKKVSNHK